MIVDEPAGIESYLSEFYERLSERYREIDQADDIALAPEELFLTAEELREFISTRQRLELRTLGRAAAETDLNLALEAEAPQGPTRTQRAARASRCFCFRQSRAAVEVEWQSQSTLRYHGRIADLAAEVTRSVEEAKTTLFVMPSLGVAERIVEILNEYNIETRLTFTGETSDAARLSPSSRNCRTSQRRF